MFDCVPVGVGHGETSCILMTAAHKYNSKINCAEQRAVCRVLWDIPDAEAVFQKHNLTDEVNVDLGDILDAFVRGLGLPRSLSEVGTMGPEELSMLARKSLQDPYAKSNPIPLTTPEQVMKILEMCK